VYELAWMRTLCSKYIEILGKIWNSWVPAERK
jgi:hypothetical protein